MNLKTTTFIVLVFLTQNLFAQTSLPVIKSNATEIDIKVDHILYEKAWRVMPEEELDVFETSAKIVSFYTDLDSITFHIDPEVGIYDFIILLNDKDSARTQIKYEPSRLEILKGAKEYNYSDQRFIPEFTYQSQEHPDLQRIRQKLKLDSIAGEGNELMQIFNLLHWVHNTVRHDGNSYNPDNKNAVDLIQICKTENRGVNCRMLATILNECYLSMGIKSRFITCMPKESPFDDCHVINMVYSTDLNKWIWIDPTFEAYIMDDKGNLLGIEEVREKLINGEPLILNADANWNRENLQTKEEYLDHYMAKNLYRLQCPSASEYNFETWGRGKKASYVELLPLDGIIQTPQNKESTNQETGVTFTQYKTNNPNFFWAKPVF